MRLRRRVVVILTLLFLLTTAGGVAAREIIDGEDCHILPEQVVEGDLFSICSELIIDGQVTGNILGIARSIKINGQVDGNLYLLGLELHVDGYVRKDIHFAGFILEIGEDSRFDERSGLISATLSNTVKENATLPGSIVNVGYQLIVDGHIGNEVNFWGSTLYIDGSVDGNIYATVGDSDSDGVSSQIETLLIPFRLDLELADPGLTVTDNGRVTGRLEYTGPTPALLNGEVTETPIFNNTRLAPIDFTDSEQTARGIQNYLSRIWGDFITLFVIGGMAIIIMPRVMQAPLKPMQLRPISTIGVGLLSFVISFPIVLIIFLISAVIVVILGVVRLNEIAIIGAIVLGLANIGGAGLFYFIAIYVSRIIVSIAVGRLILHLLRRDVIKIQSLVFALAIGLLLVTIAGTIPIVGWIFPALALFLGLGAILSVIRAQFRRLREVGANSITTITSAPPPLPYPANQPALPYFPEDATRFAPPIIDHTERPIGTDNLPPGFDWWDEEE